METGDGLKQRHAWHLAAAPAILLLALALRLARLTFQPLWADEGYSVYFASLDPLALAQATAADIHPPLYYYGLKLWTAIFGPGDFALRLLSVCLGVLTIAVTYALARRIAGCRVGVLSALLLALSPFHIFYSQEVRMYALAALLAAASTLAMITVLEQWSAPPPGEGGRVRWLAPVAYVLLTALSLYNLYYAVFVPLAQTLAVIVGFRRQRRVLTGWLLLQLGVVALYLPWIIFASGALASYVAGKVSVEKYTPLNPAAFCAQVLAALGMGVPSAGRWFLALGALPVLLLAMLAVFRRRLDVPAAAGAVAGAFAGKEKAPAGGYPLLAVLVAGPLVCGYAVNVLWPFSPSGFPRLFVYCMPFVAILVAGGLAWLAGRWPRLAWSLVAVCGLFCAATLADFYVSPRYIRDDYRPLVRDMASLAHPDDVVVALYPWQLGFVRTYFAGKPPHLVFVSNAAAWANDPALMGADLQGLGETYGRIWFPSFEAAGRLLESQVVTYLTRESFAAFGRWYGNSRVALFSWGGLGPLQQTNVTVGGELALQAVRTSLVPTEAGRGCVRVLMQWQAVGAPPQQGEVLLRLIDDAQRAWDRRDSAPLNGELPFSAWASGARVEDRSALCVSATTPPGSYRLLLGIYDESAQRNLSLSDAAGQGMGTEVTIGQVVVTPSSYHPPLGALAIPNLRGDRFVGAPSLVGFALPSSALQPGHKVDLDLYWRTEDDYEDDQLIFVQARDKANKIWGLYEGPAVGSQYALSRWSKDEILRSQVSFLLAPDAPSGDYNLVVGWLKGRKKERVPVVGDGTEVTIMTAAVAARAHVTDLPHPDVAMDMRLGDDVQFLGYDGDVAGTRPGETLRLVLYWRALGRMDTANAIFVHLVDAQRRIWSQHDGEPANGEIPTTSWLPGEVISDTHVLVLPASLPAGVYEVEAGLYNPATTARLVVHAPDGRSSDTMTLGRVEIAP